MDTNKSIFQRHKQLSAALALALGTSNAIAADFWEFAGTFSFYDATGAFVPPADTTVSGLFDLESGTGSFSTATPFNGLLWEADVDTMLFHSSFTGGSNTAPESFTWTWTNRAFAAPDFSAFFNCRTGVTLDGCLDNVPTGFIELGSGTTNSYSFQLEPGQFAAGVFFDWSTNLDIPVLAAMQGLDDPADGEFAVASVDTDNDGTPGTAMITAPFPGQTPAFSGTMTSLGSCIYIVSAPANITTKAINDTSQASVNIGNASVSNLLTGASLDPSATLSSGSTLTPGSDVSFNTGVSTVIWDSALDPAPDCSKEQSIVVHEWNPPADIITASAIPAVNIDLGNPSDLGGILNPNGVNLTFSNDAPAEGFEIGTTVVTWTAMDDFGGTTTATQNVTISLPDGIVGTDCEIDLDTAGELLDVGRVGRIVEGRFIMRDVLGSTVGAVDETVTGDINTTEICADETCSSVGASLITDQSFFGFKWNATPIRLFEEGTWEFESCLDDGSTQCNVPTPLSLTVGPGQLGAHMLFEWSVNKNIDVAVVWDVGCGKYELTTTDPDGDGIIGSPMVDGPFKGFNASFDINTIGETPIALGGYTVSIPVSKNPIDDGSPIPLVHTIQSESDLSPDSDAIRSCVGGCYDFETSDLISVNDPATEEAIYKYAQVVIPLSEVTPFYSVYRKYDPDSGQWGPFIINDRNNVQSAPLDATTGACPEPGDGAYDRPLTGILDDKLRADDQCLQLIVEDNGPNDLNSTVDVVRDPGGVTEVPEPPLADPDTSGDTFDVGGCSISSNKASAANAGHWFLLAGFIGWLGWNRRNAVQQ